MASNKVTHGKRVLGAFYGKNDKKKMKFENKRLATFKTWSPTWPVKPQDLAEAGFYYMGVFDRVKCFSCNGEIEGWVVGDTPKEDHKKHYPQCIFMQKYESNNNTVGQGGQSDSEGDDTDSHAVLEKTPMMAVMQLLFILDAIPAELKKMCKRPEYAEEKARLKTFEHWPAQFKESAPETKWLANAGFYYSGSTDLVRCFCCSGGIDCWESNDEPWYEHAKSYPTCKWLIHVKGQSYIDAVQNVACAESDEARTKQVSPSVADQILPTQEPLEGKTDGGGSIVTIDDIMNSEPAKREATSSESVCSKELAEQKLADLTIDNEPKHNERDVAIDHKLKD